MFSILGVELGQAVPSGGAAALLVVILRMVYKDNADRRRIETELRAEHAAEMKSVRQAHKVEVDELRARITALEDQVDELRGRG